VKHLAPIGRIAGKVLLRLLILAAAMAAGFVFRVVAGS
jgi:hypothetical protein